MIYRIIAKIKRMLKLKEINQSRIARFKDNYKGKRISIEKLPRNTIAIIVPCYKHKQYLNTCLESILNQTKLPNEVIIVDDDPQSNIKGIINDFETKVLGKSLKLKVFNNQKNIGQSASINKGLDIAESDLIMIMNDDDYLMHDAVEYVFKIFKKYIQMAMFGATCIPFTSDYELYTNKTNIADYKKLQITVHNPEHVVNYRRFNDLNMTHSGCTFLKEAALSVGGYYPKIKRIVPFSDRDFQLRLNSLYLVACSYDVPFSFWRSNSSVDCGKNS